MPNHKYDRLVPPDELETAYIKNEIAKMIITDINLADDNNKITAEQATAIAGEIVGRYYIRHRDVRMK